MEHEDDEVVSVFVSGELRLFLSELEAGPLIEVVQAILGGAGFEVEDAWVA